MHDEARVSLRNRPSEVSIALDALQDGRDKRCSYCTSFFVFELGDACVQAATDIVERNAGDLVADATWKKAIAMVAFAQPGALKPLVEVKSVVAWASEVDQCMGKILSALSTWSSARTEEMWAIVFSFVATDLVAIMRHAFGQAIKLIFKAGGADMHAADVHGAEWSDAAFGECASRGKAVVALQKAVASVQAVAGDIGSLIGYGHDRLQALCDFQKKVSDIAKIGQKQRQKWIEDRPQKYTCMFGVVRTPPRDNDIRCQALVCRLQAEGADAPRVVADAPDNSAIM